MGKVKELYIEELENMSEEERAQHEINEVMSDPDAYDQLVYKELSEETSASDHSRNERMQKNRKLKVWIF